MPSRDGSNRRSKRWCFTINNPTAEEEEAVRRLGVELSVVTYICFGRERGEEDTPHLQGYVEFGIRRRFGFVKVTVCQRAHVEAAKGSPRDASDYCKKDGDWEEYGVLSLVGQGRRTDLEEIKARMDEGVSVSGIASEYFSQWVQYRRSFSAYAQMVLPGRASPPEVIVLEGATGVGKTRFATEIGIQEGGYWISSDPTLRWFDGYNGQPVAILDDYAGEGQFRFLLRLLDRYELDVPVKGGFVKWIPRIIFLTTNKSIEQWYVNEDTAPLRRRVRWELVRGIMGRDGGMSWEDYFLQMKNKLGL